MNFDERDDPFSNEYDEADDDVQGTMTDDEMSEQDIEAERDEYLEEESEDEDPEDESYSPQALGATIERGVLFLNANFPGWYTSIDLDTLDVADAGECPLAQASRQGDFLLGYDDTSVSSDGRMRHARRHGFLDSDEFSDTDLNMGWQVAIRILRLTR